MTTYLVSALIEGEEFKAVTRSFHYRVQLEVDNAAQLHHWAAALSWLCRHHGQPRFRMETHEEYGNPIFMPGNPDGVWTHTKLDEFGFQDADLAVIFKLTWGGA